MDDLSMDTWLQSPTIERWNPGQASKSQPATTRHSDQSAAQNWLRDTFFVPRDEFDRLVVHEADTGEAWIHAFYTLRDLARWAGLPQDEVDAWEARGHQLRDRLRRDYPEASIIAHDGPEERVIYRSEHQAPLRVMIDQ